MGKGEILMLMHAFTFICGLATVFAWTLLGGLALMTLWRIYKVTLRYEETLDTATIIDRYCEEGGMFTPEYFVCVCYQGMEFQLNDEMLYREAIVGSNVLVNVHRGYNRAHKLRATYLTKH